MAVYFDGQTYWLYDGFHRVAAMRKLGRRKIEAEILQGTYSDMEAAWQKGLQEILKANERWLVEHGKPATRKRNETIAFSRLSESRNRG